jgi:hypothetical protein
MTCELYILSCVPVSFSHPPSQTSSLVGVCAATSSFILDLIPLSETYPFVSTASIAQASYHTGIMAEIIREAPLGQIIRWVTRNRLLKYPEEMEGFELPATYNAVLNSTTSQEKRQAPRSTPPVSRQVTQEKTRRSSDSSESATANTASEELEKAETAQPGPYEDPEALNISRTRSRLSTVPYSEERLEVEAELAIERTQTKPIVPIKTADGVVLVDWYTTDDPANPQNWSNGKRFIVSLIICVYTLSFTLAPQSIPPASLA